MILEELADPDIAGACSPYVIAGAAQDAMREIEALKQALKQAIEAIEGAIKIAPCWLPPEWVPEEHEDEANALHAMHESFQAAIKASQKQLPCYVCRGRQGGGD